MIQPAEVKKSINETGEGESGDFAVQADIFLRVHYFLVPVAVKSEQVPEDNENQEELEFEPAITAGGRAPHPVEQKKHTGYKEDMTDFVGDKAFGSAVLLDSPGLDRGAKTADKRQDGRKNTTQISGLSAYHLTSPP